MATSNIFAIITADYSSSAEAIIKNPQNEAWFESRRQPASASMDDDQGTPAPEAYPDQDDRLVIRIPSGGWKHAFNSIRLGRNSNADIVIDSRTPGISGHHCDIIVDPDTMEVVLRDKSRWGSEVEYNHERTELPSGKEWKLAPAMGVRCAWENVVICLHNNIRLRIEFPNHEMAPPQYRHLLKSLIAFAKKDSGASLTDLTLDSRIVTQAPSGTQTPRRLPSYFKKRKLDGSVFDDRVASFRTISSDGLTEIRARDTDSSWGYLYRDDGDFVVESPQETSSQVQLATADRREETSRLVNTYFYIVQG